MRGNVAIKVRLLLHWSSDTQRSTALLRTCKSLFKAGIGLNATIPQQIRTWSCLIGPGLEIDPRGHRRSIGKVRMALRRTQGDVITPLVVALQKGQRACLRAAVQGR